MVSTGAPPVLALPGYDILGSLGRGGMGVVVKARHRALNRLVAIKMLHAGMHEDAELRSRFKTEAEAVARLQHPNIVQIFEIGEADGRPFLAFEYVGGGALSHRLQGKPQPFVLAADLVRVLALAVHHAHQQGILHRDLKPSNVLLADTVNETASDAVTVQKLEPRVAPAPGLQPASIKIADFGLAKPIDRGDGPTRVGDVLGTPSYMAPEQAGGVTKTLTAAVDTYAVGAILYELLTGRPPFLGESASQTVVMVIAQDPPSLRALRPDCPRDLETICLKCLEKKPGKRYATAADLAEDLRRFLAREPILARRAGPVERLGKWARRHPARAALVATALAFIVLLSVYGLQLQRLNARLRTAAERERVARERAEANFQKARQTVKVLLAEVATSDLESKPYMDPVRRNLLQKARSSLLEFLSQDRDSPTVRRDIAQVTADIAEISELLGDHAEAEQFLRDSLAQFRDLDRDFPHEPEFTRDAARTTRRLADHLVEYASRDEAEALYAEAIHSFEMRAKQRPDDPEPRYDLCRCRLNRGKLYATGAQLAKADADFDQARQDLEKLVAEHPRAVDYRHRLAICHNSMGVRRYYAEDYGPSVKHHGRAVELLQGALQEAPGRRDLRLHLAMNCRNLGSAAWWGGQKEPAEAGFRLAVDEYRRLISDFPHVAEYRDLLAQSLGALGEFLDFEKNPAGLDLIQEAASIQGKLCQEQPHNPLFFGSLGMTCVIRATAHQRRKEWADEVRWLEQAEAEYRHSLTLNLTEPRTKTALVDALRRQVNANLKLHEIRRAGEKAQALAKVRPDQVADAVEAAMFLARCATLSSDSVQRQTLSDTAVQLLISARRRDPTLSLSAKELDPLRSHSAFPK